MFFKKVVLFFICLLNIFQPNNRCFGQELVVKQIIWTAEWSPDGAYFAYAGNIDSIKIYKSSDYSVFRSLAVKNTVTRIKWHPTKNILVYTTQLSEDKSSIYNLEKGEKTELTGISVDGARGIDWNSDGSKFVIADNDGQIIIYNEKGELLNTIKTDYSKSYTSIDWHPTKNILLATGNNIKLFNTNGQLLKSIQHRKEDVLLLSATWHPSGKLFACGDYGDGSIKTYLQFWDENGALLQSIDISKGEYRNLVWNKKGTMLASASDKLRIWNNRAKLLFEGNSSSYLWGLSWNEKEEKIITSSLNGEVLIWNTKGEILKKIE